MGKIAYLFPGQGSQYIGMGKDLIERYASARAVFETADQVLGFPFSELILHGEKEELKQTVNAQPALLTMSIACLEAAREAGVLPLSVSCLEQKTSSSTTTTRVIWKL